MNGPQYIVKPCHRCGELVYLKSEKLIPCCEICRRALAKLVNAPLVSRISAIDDEAFRRESNSSGV